MKYVIVPSRYSSDRDTPFVKLSCMELKSTIPEKIWRQLKAATNPGLHRLPDIDFDASWETMMASQQVVSFNRMEPPMTIEQRTAYCGFASVLEMKLALGEE